MNDASYRELLWTGAMLPGFILSVYNVAGALSDVRQHWLDGYRPMGWVGLVKTAAVLLISLLILASGWVALGTPEPVRPEGDDSADFIAGCLIAVDLLVLVVATALFIERRYVVPHIRSSLRIQDERT